MKLILSFALLCCCLYLPSNAQNDSLSQAFVKKYCAQIHLSLNPKWVTSNEKIPPSFSHFEVVDFRQDTSRLGGLTQLYLKDETGKSYFSRKMWGYCDGYQCYAMMDGNLFPILPVGHAFYVFGSKQYDIKTTMVPILFLLPGLNIFGAMPISETAIRRLHFFSIDPYTGKIY